MEEVMIDGTACGEEKKDKLCDEILTNSGMTQSVPKKRNRRKERPRKNKLNPQISGESSVVAPVDSLCSMLSVASFLNGTSDLKDQSSLHTTHVRESCQENDCELVAAVSLGKKRNRKKKIVAIRSIPNLASSKDCLGVNPFSNNPNPEMKENDEFLISTETISKRNSGNNSKMSYPSVNNQSQKNDSLANGHSPKKSLKKTFDRGHKPSQPQQYSAKQQNSCSPSNQKKTSINSKKNNCMLNENKFDNHLQRELVDVMLKEQPNIAKGFIRINQRNFREAYINSPDGSKDILIDGVKDRNRALEGDEVVVSLLSERLWKMHDGAVQKVGKVIHILTQVHQRQAVGSLKKMPDGNSRMALFSPRDSRVPRIRIPLKECPKDTKDWDNRIFFARIIEWDDVRFAKGQLIGDGCGAQGDIEAETRAILLENELDCSPYDKKLYEFFPKSPYMVTEHDLSGREDLRKKCLFTIDPLTARDLDDAMSCEKLENGNYKVGVHISDVSHFLKDDTPLDKEVAKRATTTYLVQRAYHMLPREMTMMCSLLPGEDKLAFSVFWEITPSAEVISHYFTRSVINSCCQLAYEHAQIMIDEPEHDWKECELPKIHSFWTVQDIMEVVLSLQSLAAIMRKRRFDTGALRVDQTKLSFHLNDSGEPVSFSAYINKESHRLIEEFMLLANITVATDLQKRFPALAFLRCHDEPQPDMLRKLADVLEKFGIVLDPSSAGSLHESLQRCSSSGDTARFMALNCLCSKPMVRARYFCAASVNDVKYMRHYALNVPLYTHFTSPIRRYADVMVHRLLAALLEYREEPKWTVDYVNSIAANCNKMKFCAKKAGEQSSELFMALWIKNHGPVEEEAVVTDVKDHSFDALVCSTGNNIRVYTDKLPGSVEFDNSSVPQLKIIWSIAGGCSQLAYQVISMFSVVQVVLRSSSTNVLKVEASLVPPKL